MEDRVRIIENPDGSERVVICRRDDGTHSYRRQWADSSILGNDRGWGQFGPECGIYDSIEMAETEAMQRVPWLKVMFH
jgi:hypothetical protein